MAGSLEISVEEYRRRAPNYMVERLNWCLENNIAVIPRVFDDPWESGDYTLQILTEEGRMAYKLRWK